MRSTEKRIDEYIMLGLQIDLFDSNQVDTIKSRLSGVEVRVVDKETLPKVSTISNSNGEKIIIINSNLCSMKEADEEIFKIFSQIINDVHRDLYVYGQSEFVLLKKKFRSDYLDKPLLRYPEWGGILLDNAISEYSSKLMTNKKYDLDGKEIEDYTKTNEYVLANYFSKSLFSGKNSFLKLCKSAYNDVAVDTIYSKYSERENGLNDLYEILGYMGNVALYYHKGIVPESTLNRETSNVLLSKKMVRDKVKGLK